MQRRHNAIPCKGPFHYDFIPTGTATMTTAEQVKELLINNNDIQNSVQAISVVGLPRLAFELDHCHNNQVKTIRQWTLHPPGVEMIEPTDESNKYERWIVVVLRDKYENTRQWILKILSNVPSLMTEFDYKVIETKFEISHQHYLQTPLSVERCNINK